MYYVPNEQEREIFERYKKGFSNTDIKLISDKEGSSHWQNGIVLDKIDAENVTQKLISMGIEARRGFNPMHKQEAFSEFDYITKNNVSEDLFNKTILLPSGAGTTLEEIDYVIETVLGVI